MKYNMELELDDNNALNKILSQITSNSLVLEFGPANGRLTKYMKDILNCSVYIVEIDQESAKDAMIYAVDGIVGNIEDMEWLDRWNYIKFDYIIFADVLEHLSNPQEVLIKTNYLLSESGKVLLSVPNVAHSSIMISTYLNNFIYTPLGLLDDTHIHLFAYNSLIELCRIAGYVPIIEDATYSNVGDNEVNAWYEQIPHEVRKVYKNKLLGLVYQFVFTMQKKWYVNTHSVQIRRSIIMRLPQYHLKIYVDLGDSWREDSCYDFNIIPEGTIEISTIIEHFDAVKRIRIDLLDTNGIFKIKEISLYDEEGVYELKRPNWYTGLMILDEYQADAGYDPQIIFECSNWANTSLKGTVSLKVKYEIILFENDSLESVINHILVPLHEIYKENTLKLLELEKASARIMQADKDLEAKENEIVTLNESIHLLNAQLESITDKQTKSSS